MIIKSSSKIKQIAMITAKSLYNQGLQKGFASYLHALIHRTLFTKKKYQMIVDQEESKYLATVCVEK